MSRIKLIITCAFLLLSVLFSSFGYASVTDTLYITGTAVGEPTLDIFISSVEILSGNAVINYHNLTVLSSTVNLAYASDSVSLRITVTNNSSTHKVFNAVKYIDSAYSNQNIGYELSGIMTGDHVSNVPGENTKSFEITFSLVGEDRTNLSLESILLFEFADEADWENNQPGTGGGTDAPDLPTIEVGEDFAALIEAARSSAKNSYGLNDKNKGSVLVNAVKQKGILYSNDNRVSGGNLQHFASSTINAHKLDYLFEYVSDTEYVLYMWRLNEVDAPETVIDVSAITVYKQVYHYIDGVWEKSATMAGHSVIRNLRKGDGGRAVAIVPSEWQIGALISE